MSNVSERNAFLLLQFEKYQGLVERTCWRMVNYQRQYDDLVNTCVQEVFLTVAREYPKLKDHENLPGWMVQTTRNRMKNEMRKLRNNEAVVISPLDENIPAAVNGIDQWYEQYRESETVMQIRKLLTDNEWPIFKQFYLCGNSISDIARSRNSSVSSITSALHRLRKRIISNIKWPFIIFFVICVTFH